MMSWSSRFYILCAITYAAVLGTKLQSSESKLHDDRLKAIGYTTRDREKRAISALVKIGIEVLEVLLIGTKPLPSQSKNYKLYQKPGNIGYALFDFKAVVDKSRGIKYIQNGRTRMWSGYRGDRKLILDDPGFTGNPTLEIRKMKPTGATPTSDDVAKIIYVEKRSE